MRNASLRRPDTLRPHAEDSLMQIKPALQLLSRILRMSKPILRQRQPWRRNPAFVRVTDQRQDRMIKGRSRNLDISLLGRSSVRGKNSSNQFTLAADDKVLIVK